MPTNCCIDGCTSSTNTHCFLKDDKERSAWVNAIPLRYNLKYENIKNYMVICSLHWPANFETINVKGRTRPKHPPTSWNGIPLPTTTEPIRNGRPTVSASSHVRNQQADEQEAFNSRDKLDATALQNDICKNLDPRFLTRVITFFVASSIYIQSKSFLHGIPQFLLVIFSKI